MQAALQRVGARAVTVLRDALYPVTCLMCDARVEEEGALCPACWADTPFLSGACCELCGTNLPGEDDGGMWCDDCLTLGRPWDEGHAAMAYAGTGRRLVLSFKHGDRTELATGAARWIHRRARDILTDRTLLVPVPVHRWRLLRRRYNQAALLAKALALRTGGPCDVMALTRHRQTLSQDHRSVPDRFANIADAISVTPGADIAGRHVAVVDDVMTSGATLAACADALRQAGAARISVLILARVAKDR
ncbi:ComF family protein [Jannaschia donghaensis]|uniref:DNA utilization protein GntX n=1 Tax=Jannaschia donghaensis TaxID=420998 RepID=A0A0M6YH89_9RHOB|nr:ComF family protein [Jannaschia donghaensis]CTQ49284.1 DNA utilization protein GntX [Jannaschia donghaensis]